MILSTGNIRGLNQDLKQKELVLFLKKNKINFYRCIKTRVKEGNSRKILNNFTKE